MTGGLWCLLRSMRKITRARVRYRQVFQCLFDLKLDHYSFFSYICKMCTQSSSTSLHFFHLTDHCFPHMQHRQIPPALFLSWPCHYTFQLRDCDMLVEQFGSFSRYYTCDFCNECHILIWPAASLLQNTLVSSGVLRIQLNTAELGDNIPRRLSDSVLCQWFVRSKAWITYESSWITLLKWISKLSTPWYVPLGNETVTFLFEQYRVVGRETGVKPAFQVTLHWVRVSYGVSWSMKSTILWVSSLLLVFMCAVGLSWQHHFDHLQQT